LWYENAMLVVNVLHWLDTDGSLPTENLRLRRQALRVARLIEYGGPLAVNETRETLIECSRRSGRRPCIGLLWVTKIDEKTLDADCPSCNGDEVAVTGWEGTQWAEGMMEPVPFRPAGTYLPS
jgi:hypothetical protein